MLGNLKHQEWQRSKKELQNDPIELRLISLELLYFTRSRDNIVESTQRRTQPLIQKYYCGKFQRRDLNMHKDWLKWQRCADL
jgi:hypothetical protein